MRRILFQPVVGAGRLATFRQPITVADGFLPSDLSGLQLWTESAPHTGNCYADAAGTIQAQGSDYVFHWHDKSGNARHLTDRSSNKPPYLVNSGTVTQPYGKPEIIFVASTNDRLQAATAADWKFLHDGTGCTGFLVYKQTNNNVGCLLDTGGYAGAAGTGTMLYIDDSASARIVYWIGKGSNIVNLSPAVDSDCYPSGNWHIIRFSFLMGDTPYGAQLFGDGCFHYGGDASAAPATGNPSGALRIGLDINGVSSNAFSFDGSMASVILYNRKLSISECRLVENYLSVKWPVPVGNVALLGDSIMAGVFAPVLPETRLRGQLGPEWRVTNFANSGARIDQGSPDVKDQQWLSTSAGARRRGYNFIVVAVGINDVSNSYAAATCYTELQTIYNSVLADPNNRLIVCTLMPFGGYSGYSAPKEAIRVALNDNIRTFAAANANTHLVDLATIMAEPSDSTYLLDQYNFNYLHPNQIGSDAMCTALADKLLQIGLL